MKEQMTGRAEILIAEDFPFVFIVGGRDYVAEDFAGILHGTDQLGAAYRGARRNNFSDGFPAASDANGLVSAAHSFNQSAAFSSEFGDGNYDHQCSLKPENSAYQTTTQSRILPGQLFGLLDTAFNVLDGFISSRVIPSYVSIFCLKSNAELSIVGLGG